METDSRLQMHDLRNRSLFGDAVLTRTRHLLLITFVVCFFARPLHAEEIDANGNKLSGSNDNKVVKLDSSENKETAPAQKSWCETPPSWEIRVGLPGWASSLSGDFGVKGVVTPLNVNFETVLKHLEAFPIAVSAYARYQRWELFGDGEWIQLHESVSLPGLLFTNADLKMGYAFWEGFAGYRLINCDKIVLSLYAGARYNYYSGDFHIENNSDPRFPIIRQLLGIPNSLRTSGSIDWVDPIVGLSARVRVCAPVALYANGDVGGFDVNSGSAFKLGNVGGRPALVPSSSSDWSYQAQAGMELQLTRHIWSQIGWRYLKYDYKIRGFVNETDLNGPFFQTGISF